MNSKQILSLIILAGGVVLLVLGISEWNSFNSSVSEFFTGTPTDRSVWFVIAGIVFTVIGLGGVSFLRTS